MYSHVVGIWIVQHKKSVHHHVTHHQHNWMIARISDRHGAGVPACHRTPLGMQSKMAGQWQESCALDNSLSAWDTSGPLAYLSLSPSKPCGWYWWTYAWEISLSVAHHTSKQPTSSPPSLCPLTWHWNEHKEYGHGITIVFLSLVLQVEWPISYQPLQEHDWHHMHSQSCMKFCKADISQVRAGWALEDQSRNGWQALDGWECLPECPTCHL